MQPTWHGPFQIIAVGDNPAVVKLQGSYEHLTSPFVIIKCLRQCYDIDDHPVINPADLVWDTEQTVPSGVLPTKSFIEDDDDEDEFEVDQVLGKQHVLNAQDQLELQYLISFKGYNGSSNMWLPKQNLACDQKIAQFERRIKALKPL